MFHLLVHSQKWSHWLGGSTDHTNAKNWEPRAGLQDPACLLGPNQAHTNGSEASLIPLLRGAAVTLESCRDWAEAKDSSQPPLFS